MAEKLILTTPISITGLEVMELNLSKRHKFIHVIVVDDAGNETECVYDGATAVNLIKALNKANLTIKSLERRILEQLVADGKLVSGAVNGTPD